ncbi:MAG: hypothetical protein S4CHLAM102_04920 [Chlamydiia bacterium]|nr:hypothetical protein [Chlamydiia bacterium]
MKALFLTLLCILFCSHSPISASEDVWEELLFKLHSLVGEGGEYGIDLNEEFYHNPKISEEAKKEIIQLCIDNPGKVNPLFQLNLGLVIIADNPSTGAQLFVGGTLRALMTEYRGMNTTFEPLDYFYYLSIFMKNAPEETQAIVHAALNHAWENVLEWYLAIEEDDYYFEALPLSREEIQIACEKIRESIHSSDLDETPHLGCKYNHQTETYSLDKLQFRLPNGWAQAPITNSHAAAIFRLLPDSTIFLYKKTYEGQEAKVFRDQVSRGELYPLTDDTREPLDSLLQQMSGNLEPNYWLTAVYPNEFDGIDAMVKFGFAHGNTQYELTAYDQSGKGVELISLLQIFIPSIRFID